MTKKQALTQSGSKNRGQKIENGEKQDIGLKGTIDSLDFIKSTTSKLVIGVDCEGISRTKNLSLIQVSA